MVNMKLIADHVTAERRQGQNREYTIIMVPRRVSEIMIHEQYLSIVSDSRERGKKSLFQLCSSLNCFGPEFYEKLFRLKSWICHVLDLYAIVKHRKDLKLYH